MAGSYTWNSLDPRTGRLEAIESYLSLEDAVKDMALLGWEDPSPRAVDYVTNDSTGAVVAVAMFGAESELFIATYDGRYLAFERPESDRGDGEENGDKPEHHQGGRS